MFCRNSLFAGLMLAALVPAAAQANLPAGNQSWPGLESASFETKAGRVTVHLPDDIRAGDTISGTVTTEPAGKDAAERARNSDTLSGYVIDLGGSRAPLSGRVLKFAVPAGGTLALALLGSNGKRLAAVRTVVAGPPASASAGVLVPPLGQAGRPLTVTGPFDGDMANTKVSVGGQPCEVIAESPRGVVFRNPGSTAGVTQIQIDEAGRRTSAPYRVVAIELSAGKTSLLKGEKTVVTVQMSGLSGLAATPPRLNLEASPTIEMEGGNAQNVGVNVAADGTATVTRAVTAIAPGNFQVIGQIAAAASPPGRDPLYPNAIDMDGVENVSVLLAMLSDMTREEKIALLRATRNGLRQRLAASPDKAMRDWLREKLAIVEAAMDRLGIGY